MTVLILDETPPVFALADHLAKRERLNDPLAKHVHELAYLQARAQAAQDDLREAQRRAEQAEATITLYVSTIPADFSEHMAVVRRGMRT